MALAKYFAKDALAITQALNINSVSTFESILNKHIVEVVFDSNNLTSEGRMTLDLVNLLISRLYPQIKFTDLIDGNSSLINDLVNTSKAINSNIDIVSANATIKIIIGDKDIDGENAKVFYIGSDKWTAKVSTSNAVGSGFSALPFAAGFAACIGAANVFRYVFSDFLPGIEFDNDFSISLLDLNSSSNEALELNVTDIGTLALAGIGAIGNGALWAFSKLNNIDGTIFLIDKESISISNLQRYILSTEDDINRSKAEVAAEQLAHTNFILNPHKGSWQNFVDVKKSWDLEIVMTALDSARDRVKVQSTLPKVIFNGFTEQGLLGVSRHFNFIEDACVSCMYIPNSKKINRSEEVANNLGIAQHEKLVRNYLYLNVNVDENLLQLIAGANNINFDSLMHFIGTPMSEFYSNFVCGGILLALKNNSQNDQLIDAPLAFQSVLSGILLVSELFLYKAGYRNNQFPNVSHIYPLIPLQDQINPYNHRLSKDLTGRCICSDKVYKEVYQNKWMSNS